MSWILPGKLKPRPGAPAPWVAPAPGVAPTPWVAPTPEGKVPVKLTLPGTSPSGFSGPSHPYDNCLGLPLTPECKVPVKLTLPGTSPSSFAGPHCGRCPLEVDTY